MKAAALLVRLRFRRLWNQQQSNVRFSRRKKGDRGATARKSRGSAIVSFFVILIALLGFGFELWLLVEAVVKSYPADELPVALSGVLSLVCMTVLIGGMGMANKKLSRPDWDMEWLLTLPASLSTIQWMKWVERSVTDAFAWLLLFPFLVVMSWHAGWSWWSPALALALFLPLTTTLALAHLVVVTAARVFFPAPMMRNFQAVASLVTLGGTFLLLSAVFDVMQGSGGELGVANGPVVESTSEPMLWTVIDWLVGWNEWTPWGLPARLAWGGTPGEVTWWLGALVLGWAVAGSLGWVLLRALNRRGAVVGRGVLRGERRGQRDEERAPQKVRPRGIMSRELLLLARDRTRLAQAVVMPLIVIPMQVLFAPDLVADLLSDPANLAMGLLFVGTFTLLMPTLQSVSSEGDALWLSLTLPMEMAETLRRKALLWWCFSMLVAGIVGVYGAWRIGFQPEMVWFAMYGAVALYCLAFIGVALGFFACDPLAKNGFSQLTMMKYSYLMFWLAGVVIAGFQVESKWTALSLLLVLGSFAIALWQNVRRATPYLLDPVAEPEPRITLADGILAAFSFLALQLLVGVILSFAIELPQWPLLLSSFAISGAIVVAASLLVLWRRKVPELRRELGFTAGVGWGRSTLIGGGGGVVTAILGVGYLGAMIQWPFLGELTGIDHRALYLISTDAVIWFGLLAVVAAPLCEETIFRGMIFRGLRTSVGKKQAIVLSAALFAIVHPGSSAIPVFVLGLVCAAVFARTRSLVAPIATHALYNLAIVLFMVFLPPPPEVVTDRQQCAAENAEACHSMGRRYYDGNLVPVDHEKSAHFHRKACRLGHYEGCYRFGILLDRGEGVEKDVARAAELWVEACEHEYPPACHDAGHTYEHDDLGEPRLDRAAELFAKGCEQENDVSCRHLAEAYAEGEGVDKDEEAATKYYARGCELGDEKSCQKVDQVDQKTR